MAPPLILLPPSEGKAPGGEGAPWSPGSMRFPELDASRRAVMGALARTMRTNAAACGKLLGVKGTALAAARATNRSLATAPTMPAIERYTGVLYDELDHASLPARSRKRAADQIVIFSALWGLVTPTDPIPDYKLKMGAALAPMGRTTTWWRPQLTAALAPLVAGRTVWDLLPNEHAAAWSPDPSSFAARVSVKFVDDTGTGAARKTVTVSHWNKLLKGALVRHVLATQLDDPAGLAEFDHPLGYRYRPELTTVGDDGHIEVSLVARRP
ncbi:MAG: peroxide stress protein YaaA [Acidimicrobiales bacterium]